jgi:hypothetical protein
MLESKDYVLVATSLVLALTTIVSVSIEIERQLYAVGKLTTSKCESSTRESWHDLTDECQGFSSSVQYARVPAQH